MASTSPHNQSIKPILAKWFQGRRGGSFLDTILLPYILPVGLGIILALISVSLLIDKDWLVLIPIVFIVPAAILFLRYPFVAVVIWLLVFPFFIEQTIPGSRYVYWAIHRAMIPGAFGIALLSELLSTEKKRVLRLGAAEVSMLLFLLLSVINILLLNSTPISALIRFYDRIFVPFCMYGLVRLTDLKEQDLKWIAIIAPVPIVTQSVIGLMSWFAPGKLPGAWLNRVGERTVGTFGTPGVLSIVMIFFALFLFQYAMMSKTLWVRLACFSLISLSLFMVFFSFSRGSWLGALIVCIGLLFLYPRVTFRLGATLLILTAIVGLTFFRTFITFAQQRLFTQSTAEGRVIGDLATLRVIESSPLFGVGYGNHELYDEQYRGRVLDFAVNNAHTSHNTYLLLTAEMGVVGLVLYMFPLLWWWLASRKAQSKMPQFGFMSRRMLIMMWLLLFGYVAIASFTDLFQSNLFATTIWWMIMGLVANLSVPYLAPAAERESVLSPKGQPAKV